MRLTLMKAQYAVQHFSAHTYRSNPPLLPTAIATNTPSDPSLLPTAITTNPPYTLHSSMESTHTSSNCQPIHLCSRSYVSCPRGPCGYTPPILQVDFLQEICTQTTLYAQKVMRSAKYVGECARIESLLRVFHSHGDCEAPSLEGSPVSPLPVAFPDSGFATSSLWTTCS